MLAFACWMLYLTPKSQLQERWYSADLAWSTLFFLKLYIIHLLKMLYSSNLSLCESSGKIIECTLLLLWHYPSLNRPAWYIQIGGKTTIQVLIHPYEEYFTYSQVGDTAWWGLSEATKVPCEMWMALFVISNINARCWVTKGGDCMNHHICTDSRVARHPLLIAKRNANFCVGQIYWCSVEWNSHDLKGMQHGW